MLGGLNVDILLPRIVAVGIFNAQVTPKRNITENRKTTMFEIELPILEGGTSYINNEHRKITCNTVICAKPGQLRHTKLPYRCYYIHMIVSTGQLYDALQELPDFMEIANVRYIKELFERLYSLYNTGLMEDELMVQSLILELVYFLKKNFLSIRNQKGLKEGNRQVIEDTLEYIRENLTSEMDLAFLANRASFSKIYFHKLFKASTGRTIHQYIEEQRIKKAINLMMSTDMTLSQVAYECGFSSQSYFCYAFKRNTGLTPRAYTKEVAKQYSEGLA